MKKLLVTLSLFAALGLSFCSAVKAETYDLTADFSPQNSPPPPGQNPNGVWSYGWTENRGSTFNLATDQGEERSHGHLIGWIPYESIISPAYAADTWDPPGEGEVVPVGTVNLHPGSLGQNSVIRWTAPSAGTYTIQGWFKGNNCGGPTSSPTSTDVAIMHGTTKLSGEINNCDVPLNFSLTEQVNAGDTIDFAVGYGSNGNYFGDATGISATISLVEEELTSLDSAILWVGLKNSDDQGTKFDLRTEVYINDVLVSDGITRCITGVTRNPNKAKEVAVAFGSISDGALASGDVLSLKILTRIGTNQDDTKCPGHANAVGLRVYYGAISRPSGFGAELTPDPLKDFFLYSDGTDFLNDTAPTAPTAALKDSPSVNFTGGNPWKIVGTWSMTLP